MFDPSAPGALAWLDQARALERDRKPLVDKVLAHYARGLLTVEDLRDMLIEICAEVT